MLIILLYYLFLLQMYIFCGIIVKINVYILSMIGSPPQYMVQEIKLDYFRYISDCQGNPCLSL